MPKSNLAEDLMKATGANEAAKVDAVLAKGVPVDAIAANGRTSLQYAALQSFNNSMTALLKAGADPNIEDAGKETPLLHAARAGNAAGVRALLEAGADVNHLAPPANWNALYLACGEAKKNYTETIQVLIDAGGNVNAELRSGYTVLAAAASSAQPEAVQALIDAGADVNAERDYCGSALATAIQENKPKNVEVLLRAGANIDVKLSADYTEEKVAGLTLKEMATKLKRKKIIPLLEQG